jgi:phosphatidylglycerophosphatase C
MTDPASDWIVAVTSAGHLLAFPAKELPELDKGKGNKLIQIPPAKLKSGEERVLAVAAVRQGGELTVYSGKTETGVELARSAGLRGHARDPRPPAAARLHPRRHHLGKLNAMAADRVTVVFDFDHTLTSWDSSDRFFRWLLKRDWWRLALVVVALPVLGPLFLIRRTRWISVRFVVWASTLFLSHERIALLASEHVAAILASGQSLLLREGSSRLLQHLQEGHTVVVATGSLQLLARLYLDQCALGHVPLVGSSTRRFLGGMVVREHCFGDGKIPMLSERGYPPPWAVTYTDHECDLPVIGHSAQCFLVNPKPQAVRAITDSLKSTPTVLSWR